MKLGIIGYANNCGLGNMTQDLIRVFDIDKHMICDGGSKGTYPELSTAKDKVILNKWAPLDSELRNFLSDVDVMFTVETTYNPNLFKICREMGVKTVFLPMWEWFEWERYYGADIYICTSKFCVNYLKKDIPNGVPLDSIVDLPWPVDTNKFKFKERCRDGVRTFVHNAGFGGLNWRKGTIEATNAFMMLDNPDIRLLLRAQFPLSMLPNYEKIMRDNRIHVVNEDMLSNEMLYEDGDVLLYPARYDGQALVVEEAMACGFPVYFTDASPMNEFCIDNNFSICLERKDRLNIHNHTIDMNIASTRDLAEKMNSVIGKDLSEVSRTNRKLIEEKYSWNVLKDEYIKYI